MIYDIDACLANLETRSVLRTVHPATMGYIFDDTEISPISKDSGIGTEPSSAWTEKLPSPLETKAPQISTVQTDVEATHPSSWEPSILRIGPLSGIVALAFAVLQICASYLILFISDGQPIHSWKWQPSVYLAILTAISNKALAFAVVQGAVVTFWLHALRGTTLAQLHRDWACGLHVYKAISAGRHFSILALACICATIVGKFG
jgi:hypothetical protein